MERKKGRRECRLVESVVVSVECMAKNRCSNFNGNLELEMEMEICEVDACSGREISELKVTRWGRLWRKR